MGIGESDWPQVVEVQLDGSACAEPPQVTFAYDRAFPDGDFTTTVVADTRAPQPGITRIILPVFERYIGLRFPEATARCVVGVSRFAHPASFPLLFGATLQPGWQAQPLYARFGS
jgi:hypothetical protein